MRQGSHSFQVQYGTIFFFKLLVDLLCLVWSKLSLGVTRFTMFSMEKVFWKFLDSLYLLLFRTCTCTFINNLLKHDDVNTCVCYFNVQVHVFPLSFAAISYSDGYI